MADEFTYSLKDVISEQNSMILYFCPCKIKGRGKCTLEAGTLVILQVHLIVSYTEKTAPSKAEHVQERRFVSSLYRQGCEALWNSRAMLQNLFHSGGMPRALTKCLYVSWDENSSRLSAC